MSDQRLDQAIDEVARALTRGEPGGAFRARVMARIDAGAAPRSMWSPAWLLAPIAVAAAIVIAVMVGRRPGPLGPGVATTKTAIAASGAVESASPNGPALLSETAVAALVVKPERAGTRLAPAGPQEPTLQLDALVAPRLDVASIAVDALTSNPIQIERLDAISPIVVAPLDITDIQRRYE